MTIDAEDPQSDPLVEIDAMKSVAQALQQLNEGSRGRVLRWAVDRFGVEMGDINKEKGNTKEEQSTGAEGTPVLGWNI